MRAWVYLKKKIFSKTLVYMMIGSTPDVDPISFPDIAGVGRGGSRGGWDELDEEQAVLV